MAETIGMTIGIIVGIITILGFFGAVFSHFVLEPLKKAIEDLQKVAQAIQNDIKTAEERRHELEIKVAQIEQSTRSAHHRIDDHLAKVVE